MSVKLEYEKNGYVVIKNFFSKDFCRKIRNATSKLKPKLIIPFSDVPYGFGDVRKIKPFDKISNSNKIKKTADILINSSTSLSHFMLVNKAAWIGPDAEWHQEIFNLQIYAPGCSPKKDWKKFLQVFIAIDKHSKRNSCLKVFKGSHKAGILEYEDIVNINCSHKRRVKTKSLNKLIKKYDIVDIEMNEGDALFFNHLLVHGSPSNVSPFSRLSALLQFYDKKLTFKTSRFENYSSFRTKFISNYLIKSLNKLKKYKRNLSDFKK